MKAGNEKINDDNCENSPEAPNVNSHVAALENGTAPQSTF